MRVYVCVVGGWVDGSCNTTGSSTRITRRRGHCRRRRPRPHRRRRHVSSSRRSIADPSIADTASGGSDQQCFACILATAAAVARLKLVVILLPKSFMLAASSVLLIVSRPRLRVSVFLFFAAGLWFIKNQVGEFVHGHLSGSLHAGGAGFKDARADPNSSGPSALPSGPWPETPISLN